MKVWVTTLYPIIVALKKLLKGKKSELRRSTLERFLIEVDQVAPWLKGCYKAVEKGQEALEQDLLRRKE